MNYATDRLDRKSRSRDGLLGLFQDFQQALQDGNHSRLAQVALYNGSSSASSRGAVYHAGLAWILDPDNPVMAGDYAQICELNGYPEIGMLALLCFRLRGPLRMKAGLDDIDSTAAGALSITFEEWLMETNSCGCGSIQCGEAVCFVPMAPEAIQVVQALLRRYLLSKNDRANSNQQVPSAHEVLMRRAKKASFDIEKNGSFLPLELQFWEEIIANSESLRSIPVVLQTLLIKLLYLTIPGLASDALMYASLLILQDNQVKSYMVQHHKSYLAYFVLMDALMFGSKHALVKPGRRHALKYFHVPLHDQFHGLDVRLDRTFPRAGARTHTDGVHGSIKCSHGNGQGHDRHTRPYTDSTIERFFEKLDQVVGVARARHANTQDECELTWILPSTSPTCEDVRALYLIGDSHVLSLAWQKIQLESGEFRRIVPVVATGLKAWHVRRETKFFTRTNLTILLEQRLQSASSVLFSAGEIDCREGLGGPLLEGYHVDDHLVKQHVERTVREYVDALAELVEDPANNLQQILVLPVAPHAAKATSRIVGQASRRETTRVWNETLRRILPTRSVYCLDYSDKLLDKTTESYTLLRALDADSTHMNAAFAPLLEESIAMCGCKAELL